MGFQIESRQLQEIVVLIPDTYQDERGYFMETYRADRFQKLGLPSEFVQDNQSHSRKGVLRGLHIQWDPPLGKLMRVVSGRAFLVAVDIRKGSPTLGKWFGLEASADNRRQVWAPAGFARGIYVLSDSADIQYKCTALYNPATEAVIRWNDPEIAIQWPGSNPILSPKDRDAGSLAEWLASPASESLRYPS
jgi:dTDP-4-dehydrorhamnose 3,5-epimerase